MNRFNYYSYSAAREGFKETLKILLNEGRELLLPGYIGFSTREGSGIYDPVRETGIEHKFYPFSENFEIDLKKLEELLIKPGKKAILLVNYFGFPYRNKSSVMSLVKKYNVDVIEDCAHSLYTFYRSHDYNFRFAFFSLHKMFHYETGGVLLTRENIPGQKEYGMDFFHYDLQAISEKRRENYLFLLKRFKEIDLTDFEIIFPEIEDVVPQTFPILVSTNKLKDHLYFKMNDLGYKVVSLYHTMIDNLPLDFKQERKISSRILNLPVHQETNSVELELLLQELLKLLRSFKEE